MRRQGSGFLFGQKERIDSFFQNGNNCTVVFFYFNGNGDSLQNIQTLKGTPMTIQHDIRLFKGKERHPEAKVITIIVLIWKTVNFQCMWG